VRLLDEVEQAKIYVGGVPVESKPPLNYRIVYAVESLLNLYQREVMILEDGTSCITLDRVVSSAERR